MTSASSPGRTVSIARDQARRLALHGALIDGRTKLPAGKEGVVRVIQQLGYVQIDTISVIERAHHHSLWVRRPKYRHQWLDSLLADDRRVFEYWGHAASYLPIEDYRFYLPKMRSFDARYQDRQDKWSKERMRICQPYIKPVMDRIRDEGPLAAADFENPPGKKSGWWNWKPAKIALELLMWQGRLSVCGRRKFQRLYDLTERFLPPHIDLTMPTDEELGDFLVQRALRSLGLATEAEIRDHIRGASVETIHEAIDRALESGDVMRVTVQGNGREQFASADGLDTRLKMRRRKPILQLLSPFDNLVILRDRLQRFFDFDYTIECYVPAPKRKWGYFVLPILWGERLVGRLDPKADRKAKTLLIERLRLEDDFTPDDAFAAALSTRLRDLATFCACDSVKIGKTTPTNLRKQLSK